MCVFAVLSGWPRLRHSLNENWKVCLVFLRYVFGYQKISNIQAKGFRSSGQKVTHVVSSTMMIGLLRSLLRDRFGEEPSKEETEIQVKKSFLLSRWLLWIPCMFSWTAQLFLEASYCWFSVWGAGRVLHVRNCLSAPTKGILNSVVRALFSKWDTKALGVTLKLLWGGYTFAICCCFLVP